VEGDWRRLYNEELRNLYTSRSIIKSLRLGWTRHVAHMKRMYAKF